MIHRAGLLFYVMAVGIILLALLSWSIVHSKDVQVIQIIGGLLGTVLFSLLGIGGINMATVPGKGLSFTKGSGT